MLPAPAAPGNAFSRRSLGVRPAGAMRRADELGEPAQPDRPRVPRPASPTPIPGSGVPAFTAHSMQIGSRCGVERNSQPFSVTRTSSSKLTIPNDSVRTFGSIVNTFPASTHSSTVPS
jgi:hypothetical protein